MGGSNWSDDHYKSRAATRAATNAPTFAHNVANAAKPVHLRAVHPRLDPKGVTRESCDSPAHPKSRAIGVMFDVTGSMGQIPVTLQKKLPQLMSLLIRKGYVEDPQILMGCVGDAFADKGSLQVGQFESGVEMDVDIEHMWLEGGGGGSGEESYQNAMYFFARHTRIDCFSKRGEKGYLFLIGDELAYPNVTAGEALAVMGDKLERNIPTTEIVAELKEKWHVFFIIPKGAHHGGETNLALFWKMLIGDENVILLDEPDGVCESIALAIGLCEGTVDLATGAAHIRDGGGSATIASSVSRALDTLAQSTALARPGTGNLPERIDAPTTSTRL